MFYVLKSVAKSSSLLNQRLVVGLVNCMNYSIDKSYIKNIFEKLDANKDGVVDKQDLRHEVLETFLYTFEYDDKSLDKAFSKLDKAKKGSASLEDVEAYFSSIKLPPDEKLTSEFKLIDQDKDGMVSLDDYYRHYGLDKGDFLVILLKREFKMMGKKEHDHITLEEFLGRFYYRYFLASVFEIEDKLDIYK